MGAARVDDRPRDEDLAARGPGRNPRAEVHLASVVVAVPVEHPAVVDADPRPRPLVAHQGLEPDRPFGEDHRIARDHHHLVADRLDDPGVVGQRRLDRLDEALDGADRLLLADLLGEARVAGEVRERDRDAQAAEVDVTLVAEVGLHVPDDVLLHEVLEEALMDVVHHRRGERQQLAREPFHLLGHLEAGNPVAHQGLVNVEGEELDLRVGDLGERLPVHAHELEERDEREPGGEDRRPVAKELEVVLGEVVSLGHAVADRRGDALHERRLEVALLGDLLEGVPAFGHREEVLDIAEGEPAGVARAADLLEGVPARTQARDDPRMRGGGRGPFALPARDQPLLGPAAQGLRRRPGAPRSLAEGESLVRHA